MNTIIPLPELPECPACYKRHDSLAACPLCERTMNQAVLGNLGVFDGLPIREEDDEDDTKYAAFVLCGCGFVGPSAGSCRKAVETWNANAKLIRLRIEQGVPINPNNVLERFRADGFSIPEKEAA
jgi:hypothetical protein